MRVRLVHQEGRRALAVGDVVQSIEVVAGQQTPGYWPEMLPPDPPTRALLLGHGGGTVARLLLEVSPRVAIVAVDDDAEVLDLAATDPRLRLDSPRLRVVRGDAFAVTREMADAGERFDYIAVDLYRGQEIVRASLARPFLRRVVALLAPGGTAAFNLARDGRTGRRLRRLGQYFRLGRTALVGLNCVVHAHVRRAQKEPE